MAEVIGVASGVLALLEVSLAVFERIRKARNRQKDLGLTMERYSQEVKATMAVIQVVKEEEALQIASVRDVLSSVEVVVNRLLKGLGRLERIRTKGLLQQFSFQLVRGSRDDKDLIEIMKDLSRAKDNLSLKIQVANVGMVRNVHGSVVATAAAVNRNHTILEGTARKDHSLGDNGKVPKRHDTLGSLPDSETLCSESDLSISPIDSPPIESRLVIENSSQGHALQINAPIGEDGWREVGHLEIISNQASGKSIQFNHATSMDVFQQLLAARRADIGAHS